MNLLKSYLTDWELEIKINAELSNRYHIQLRVPQGSILGPFLYLLYTSDIPPSIETTIGTFADDSAIFATEEDAVVTTTNLQEHLNFLGRWLNRSEIILNENICAHIIFTLPET